MGEWQAWHPTVSRPSRSTDITDGFGPGTRWSAGPESYIDEVVAASPGLLLAASPVFRVPSGPPARLPSGFAVPSGSGEPVLVPEGGGPPARSPHASLRLGVVDLEARPGPAAALRHPECTLARRHPPHWWRGCVVSGQALRSRQHPPHWWRGCVVGGQALPPPSGTEVVAASLVFRVPSGPPARSPSAPRAYGSARRLEARPGPAVPTVPSTLVAWVCRGRPGPNVADPRPRRRITVHTTACAKM